MITSICGLFRPEEAISSWVLAGFGECYATKFSHPDCSAPVEFEGVLQHSEVDSMSTVLLLHKKPVYRFSQTRKIICVYIFFVSYNRYFIELPTLFFAKALLGKF